MTLRAWALAGTASMMALSGIVSAHAQALIPQLSESQPTTAPISVFVPSLNPVPLLDERAKEGLHRAVKGEQRIDAQRDRWRNPEATLQFFGVLPTDTVVEIWPGQGWYTSILGPYLKQGNGKLIVGHFDAASSNSPVVRQMVDAYRTRFAADAGVYGSVSVVPFGPRSMPMAPPNSVDKVLTFRNIHNWMAQGWAEKAFADFYLVLKPGGILGIEEHRGRTDEPQDPLARDGYVREDYVIQMAREAGFEFIGGAEINANPADTKDHPFGVWTLPPVSRTSPIGQVDDPGFDRSRYDEIGESDRMTLRFRKPLDATGVGLASSRPTADQIPVTIVPGPPPPPPPPRRGRRGTPPPAPVTTPVTTPVATPATAPQATPASAPATLTAGSEAKLSAPNAAPGVDAKEAATSSAAGLRSTTDDAGAKQAPAAPPPPPPVAAGRRGSAPKGRTPSPPAPPTPTKPDRGPAGAKPQSEAVPQAESTAASTPSATPSSGQRGRTAADSKPAAPTEAAPKSKGRPASSRPVSGASDATSKAGATPADGGRSSGSSASGNDTQSKSSSTTNRTRTSDEPKSASSRATQRPAAEPPETKASTSKSKSKNKATEAERSQPTARRGSDRSEPSKDSKKKAAPKAAPKAKPKATPAKKSPPPAKANPNKPDWVLPPKKKPKN